MGYNWLDHIRNWVMDEIASSHIRLMGNGNVSVMLTVRADKFAQVGQAVILSSFTVIPLFHVMRLDDCL